MSKKSKVLYSDLERDETITARDMAIGLLFGLVFGVAGFGLLLIALII